LKNGDAIAAVAHVDGADPEALAAIDPGLGAEEVRPMDPDMEDSSELDTDL